MSEKWQHLKLENKDYEWSTSVDPDKCTLSISYKKREPLPPTHSEIMTLWWKTDSKNWFRVTSYHTDRGIDKYYVNDKFTFFDKKWFTNRKSAVIPPEAK